jgi:hypothetical protein
VLAIVLAALLAISLVVSGLAWRHEHAKPSAQERIALARGLALQTLLVNSVSGS